MSMPFCKSQTAADSLLTADHYYMISHILLCLTKLWGKFQLQFAADRLSILLWTNYLVRRLLVSNDQVLCSGQFLLLMLLCIQLTCLADQTLQAVVQW